jgi:hypothetical protein
VADELSRRGLRHGLGKEGRDCTTTASAWRTSGIDAHRTHPDQRRSQEAEWNGDIYQNFGDPHDSDDVAAHELIAAFCN